MALQPQTAQNNSVINKRHPDNENRKQKRNHTTATSIYSGQLTCLIGENGVGKSTLLRTLAHFLPQLQGTILINNTNVDTLSNQKMAQQVSVVLTNKLDVMNMTAEEVVGLGRTPYTGFWGTLNEKDKEIVKKSIQLVGIEHLANRMLGTLSDGERQKTMIAKALAQQTSVIFLDEPTAFLDYPSKVEMMQLLTKLSRETGKTIFLSTHDIELVLQIADTIWLMTRNHPITTGSPKQLADSGALSAFLNRKGILFDPQTMTVKVNRI